MLVLSRKVGERVVIDGKVTVVVTRVVGNRVTLGIEAPADVHVLRGELQDTSREASRAQELAAKALEVEAPAVDSGRSISTDGNGAAATGAASSGSSGAGATASPAARPAPLAAMTAAVLASHAASGAIAASP